MNRDVYFACLTSLFCISKYKDIMCMYVTFKEQLGQITKRKLVKLA